MDISIFQSLCLLVLPVMVVALLAPDTGGAEHLRVLARLSRILRDPHQCEALRATPDTESLRQALTYEAEEQNAA